MDLEYSFFNNQAITFIEAIKLKSNQCHIPKIERYCSQRNSDYETQHFNLYAIVPLRLRNEDDIAMWFLENDLLNRYRVFDYLTTTRSDDIPRTVLEKIAIKVCSLDLGSEFVEGLKYFIPVVHSWDVFNQYSYEDQKLRILFKEYIIAHFAHSSSPLFDCIETNNIQILIDVIICILNLTNTLMLKEKLLSNHSLGINSIRTTTSTTNNNITTNNNTATNNTINNLDLLEQFTNDIQNICSNKSDHSITYNIKLIISNKLITDFFHTASNIVSLHIASFKTNHPNTNLPSNNPTNNSNPSSSKDILYNFLKLPMSTSIPSYLFAIAPRIQGFATILLPKHYSAADNIKNNINYNTTTSTTEEEDDSTTLLEKLNSTYVFIQLYLDAMYIFTTTIMSNNNNNSELEQKKALNTISLTTQSSEYPYGALVGCIPLEGLQLQSICDCKVKHNPGLVTLVNISNDYKLIPYLEYQCVTNMNHNIPLKTSQINLIDIKYYPYINIQFESIYHDNNTTTNNKVVVDHNSINNIINKQQYQNRSKLVEVQAWIDQLDSTCWEYRAIQHYNHK